MVSDSNRSNSSKLKVIVPVIFTFGASLLFFQGTTHADSSYITDTTSYSTSQTNNNAQTYTANTQYVLANQTNNSVFNQGAVNLNANAVQNANNAPVSNTHPYVTSNQVSNASAGAQNASGVTTNGLGNAYTAGLPARDVAFLNSIHQGAVEGWQQYKILPSLTAAQAITESAWGQSTLTTRAHNLFGIKGSYNGHAVNMPTYEYYGGRYVMINDNFRAYSSNNESIIDHGRFLNENSRYHNLIGQTNYRVATRLIQQDGYATSPTYTATLNSVIRSYNLTAWDQEAFNANTNTGYLDNLAVQGNRLHIAGWHASNAYNTRMHHFIILLDANSKQELYRQEVTGHYRQDVQNAYPKIAISGWGGFDFTIPYSAKYAGRSLLVVSRYTYNTNGEPNGGQDLWFNPVTVSANVGNLDDFTLNASDNTIHIAGWHASDQSMGKQHHFIIIFDASKNRELGRYEVNSVIRNDVARAYNNVYQSGKSGFDLKLKFNPALVGDQIQVISRYTDDPAGNGNCVDYWFAPKTFNDNQAYLDNATLHGNQLTVSGWHTADVSIRQGHHFVILYDATAHREIERHEVNSSYRPDVQRAYSHIYNSAWSGFNTTFTLPSWASGHNIQVISRYSNAVNGEGLRTDYWFRPIHFTIR